MEEDPQPRRGKDERSRPDRPKPDSPKPDGTRPTGEPISGAERRILRGRNPADQRVHVSRPHSRYFRYGGPGVMVAKPSVIEPTTSVDRLRVTVKRWVFGRVLATEEEAGERLSKVKALATFSSDALSSVAYATEAILFTLVAAGTTSFRALMPISFCIVAVLAIVTISYRQTIRAYPGGGGSYIVAKANLGTLPGLVAAGALLTDYVLTVSVSVASGVANLLSAFPVAALEHRTVISVALIGLVMLVNMRGIRESGAIFAVPTYIFVASVMAMLAVGFVRVVTGSVPQVVGVTQAQEAVQTFGVLLLLRAFADGCSAMTGVEAISNGVPAFKPPEANNARATMLTMAVLLGTMFIGISYLAGAVGAVPSNDETIISQIARTLLGRGAFWYLILVSATAILVLAANTSFADFPRLSSLLARDRFMPSRFAFRGERLAFNTGILVLGLLSIVVVIAFHARVNALIPLYAIGVFTSFTLSQTGMVRHWWVERGPNWRRSIAINGIGAVATAIVTIIFAIAKFALGAWVVIVIIPVLVVLMLAIHAQYRREEVDLEVRPGAVIGPPRRRQRVVVPVPRLTRAHVQAIKFARTTSQDVTAVHVTDSLEAGETFRERFERQLPGVPLVLVESPYRSLVRPFLRYLEVTDPGDDTVTVVVLPEYVTRHWWERFLYNDNSHRIRAALIGRPNLVVADVPYRRP